MTTIPLAPPSLTESSDRPGGFGRAVLERLPIWSCSVRGFACHRCCHRRGALLPHLFTLTRLPGRYLFCATDPSGCPARALPGALPCGVRTFLPLQHYVAETTVTDGGDRLAGCDMALSHALARVRPSRLFPAKSRTARASCTGYCVAYRALQRSWRCSKRAHEGVRPGTPAPTLP